MIMIGLLDFPPLDERYHLFQRCSKNDNLKTKFTLSENDMLRLSLDI